MIDWWSLVFPAPKGCWYCKAPIEPVIGGYSWQQLCSACFNQADILKRPFCRLCSFPLDDAAKDTLCMDCAFRSECSVVNRSVVKYNSWSKQVLQLFKYRGKESLSIPIGRWMAEVAKEQFLGEGLSWITFVPLSEDRRRFRGFNQAELLAQVIARCLKIPCQRLLQRVSTAKPQSQVSKLQRWYQVRDSFDLDVSYAVEDLKDTTGLLVDDVYTTGATARACAFPLLSLGVRKVCVVTFAR